MFCPECGSEERGDNLFCRSCGTDLRRLRSVIDRPDAITGSAISAREEIGRAIAQKIRETRSIGELADVAEDVLPEIEKFLESPEEKRLRRMRLGMILSGIGIGSAIALTFVAIATKEEGMLFLAGLGSVVLFIGLGFILNGIFLTIPKRSRAERAYEPAINNPPKPVDAETNDLLQPAPASAFTSVTEHTTSHLKESDPVDR